jgi:hypothetical protein
MTYLKKMSINGHGARSVLMGLVLLSVTACVEPQAQSPKPSVVAPAPQSVVKGAPQLVRGLPNDAQDYLFSAAIARQVAKRCPKEFRYNTSLARARERELETKYQDNETIRDLSGNASELVDRSKLDSLVLAYVAKRKIVIGENATWCPAGRAEVAEKTEIGKYLVVN